MWIPIPIWVIFSNSHTKLQLLWVFWYHIFQTLLIFNGRLDTINNHKYMKFHTVTTKHIINVMWKTCLTLKWVGHFFQNVISFSDAVHHICNSFIWNWSNTMNATGLTMHPCVSRCLRVKILKINTSTLHLKNKSHYFWTGVYLVTICKWHTCCLKQQGKSEGFDSCNWPSNLTPIGFKLLIFQPMWP